MDVAVSTATELKATVSSFLQGAATQVLSHPWIWFCYRAILFGLLPRSINPFYYRDFELHARANIVRERTRVCEYPEHENFNLYIPE